MLADAGIQLSHIDSLRPVKRRRLSLPTSENSGCHCDLAPPYMGMQAPQVADLLQGPNSKFWGLEGGARINSTTLHAAQRSMVAGLGQPSACKSALPCQTSVVHTLNAQNLSIHGKLELVQQQHGRALTQQTILQDCRSMLVTPPPGLADAFVKSDGSGTGPRAPLNTTDLAELQNLHRQRHAYNAHNQLSNVHGKVLAWFLSSQTPLGVPQQTPKQAERLYGLVHDAVLAEEEDDCSSDTSSSLHRTQSWPASSTGSVTPEDDQDENVPRATSRLVSREVHTSGGHSFGSKTGCPAVDYVRSLAVPDIAKAAGASIKNSPGYCQSHHAGVLDSLCHIRAAMHRDHAPFGILSSQVSKGPMGVATSIPSDPAQLLRSNSSLDSAINGSGFDPAVLQPPRMTQLPGIKRLSLNLASDLPQTVNEARQVPPTVQPGFGTVFSEAALNVPSSATPSQLPAQWPFSPRHPANPSSKMLEACANAHQQHDSSIHNGAFIAGIKHDRSGQLIQQLSRALEKNQHGTTRQVDIVELGHAELAQASSATMAPAGLAQASSELQGRSGQQPHPVGCSGSLPGHPMMAGQALQLSAPGLPPVPLWSPPPTGQLPQAVPQVVENMLAAGSRAPDCMPHVEQETHVAAQAGPSDYQSMEMANLKLKHQLRVLQKLCLLLGKKLQGVQSQSANGFEQMRKQAAWAEMERSKLSRDLDSATQHVCLLQGALQRERRLHQHNMMNTWGACCAECRDRLAQMGNLEHGQ